MQRLSFLFFLLIFLLFGCDQTPQQQTESPQPQIKSAAPAEAAKLDPGDAAGYFELSQLAFKAGNTTMALNLLTWPGEAFPENPVVSLQKAEMLVRFKLYDRAAENLAKVPKKWSATFHENIPATIAELKKNIQEESPAPALTRNNRCYQNV